MISQIIRDYAKIPEADPQTFFRTSLHSENPTVFSKVFFSIVFLQMIILKF
jgi:hypothetical protein